MRFSWTGLLLAPLLVPVIFSAVSAALFDASQPVLVFLILLVPACFVAYGTMIFLFLPCLYLLSSWRPMNGFYVCLLGLVLGAAMFVPMTLLEWKSSGPDSGPPVESFLSFAARWAADPLTAIYPVAGLITAGLYWWLGTWQRGRSMAAAHGLPS